MSVLNSKQAQMYSNKSASLMLVLAATLLGKLINQVTEKKFERSSMNPNALFHFYHPNAPALFNTHKTALAPPL